MLRACAGKYLAVWPLQVIQTKGRGGTHIDGEIEEVELDGLISAKGLAAANCDPGRDQIGEIQLKREGPRQGASRTTSAGVRACET